MTGADVSIVINGHAEGLLAAPALRSARRARAVAEQRGIVVETIWVLDQPDRDTLDQFRSALDPSVRLVETRFGDPGQARNSGIDEATGRWIAFLDADDLWAENWVADAFDHAESYGRPAVWHPEINIHFGDTERLWLHPDSEDARFDPAGLAVVNYWSALCFAPRDLLLRVPYRRSTLSNGAGFEDWTWNLAVLSEGMPHKVVPRTVHAIRDRSTSWSKEMRAVVPHPSSFFRSILADRQKRIEP